MKKNINFIIICVFILLNQNAFNQTENYTFKLSQSNSNYTLWTSTPSMRVFKDSDVPELEGSEIKVYAAKNEFEPFIVSVKPKTDGKISFNMNDFQAGISFELFLVEYVNISQATDILGITGDYPDPIVPIEQNTEIQLKAGKNTTFWCQVYVSPEAKAGQYPAKVTVAGIEVPVTLTVFNFHIPTELHVKSQMNFSHNTMLKAYGVEGTGEEYWKYVDLMKQWFIDHRLTPKSVLWSGGLTSSGGASYLDYDCNGTINDPHGIWGFEEPAKRYIDGSGTLKGTFSEEFNNGTGFPSFMAITFRNNDASADQRPNEFCNIKRTNNDWFTGNNPNSPYNKKWFEYISASQNYLKELGYLDKAYYYFANEPQNQEDYDAVAWYSQELKKAAPELKLMVSEEPKPEIYDHTTYSGAKIDIWLPVLNNYNPEISHQRQEKFGEETWIYFLHGTRPPYFNPITLDHPGIESKFTGWFLWKYRIRGIAYYSLNSWNKNPWTDPMQDNHNGDLFMFYPPSKDNTPVAYGTTNHRFVSSIRFELMRESLEDYEYLYLLNNNQQPDAYKANQSDIQVNKIISGLTSYTRDDEFMYNLRKLIGLYLGGEISSIPDIQPVTGHPRTQGNPGNYYINFQDPDGQPASSKTENGEKYYTYDGKDYLQLGTNGYDAEKGYGWYAPNEVNWMMKYDQWFDKGNELQKSVVYSDWGRKATFEFDLPNGNYNVSASIGHRGGPYTKQYITIEGIPFFEGASTHNSCLVNTQAVTISDNKLTMEIGAPSNDEYTMLNYLNIEATENQGSTLIESLKPLHDIWIEQNGVNNTPIIHFYLTENEYVTINIYNLTGKCIQSFENKEYTKGWNTFLINIMNTNTAPGMFFVQFVINDKIQTTRKCLLVK